MGSTKEFKRKIRELDNSLIQSLLLSNLDKETKETTNLFCKKFPSDRDNQPSEQDLTTKHPINLALCFAPTALCEQLADHLVKLNDVELVKLLSSVDKNKDDKDTERSVLLTFMHEAPLESRLRIVERIKSLQEDELIKLLFCGRSSKPEFKHFIKLINTADSQASISLINALGKIDKAKLFRLFQTKTYPVFYEGFIELFKQNPPEELALAILKLLDQYDSKDLHQLIFGGSQNLLNVNSFNLLHALVVYQSVTVIEEFFVILRKLDIKEVKDLLSQKGTSKDRTAIECAFARLDRPEIGIFFTQTLESNSELKSLLTSVSAFQPYSAMQFAVMQNNLPLVAYFLEELQLLLSHQSHSKETMLDVASKEKRQNIVKLFNALPIYRHIQNDGNALAAEAIKRLVKSRPSILKCRWSDQKTLLHLAAAKGLTQLVSLFIEYGALVSQKDNKGNTAIDAALKANQMDALEVLTTTISRKRGQQIELIAETLLKTPNPEQTYETLESQLKNTQSVRSIRDYSKQHQDAYLFFLTEVARLLSLAKGKSLKNAIKIYLEKNLERLHEDKSEIKSNAIQLQLITLIFSIPENERFTLLSSLSLSEEAKKELGLVLSRGLIQPNIYNQLSSTGYLYFYQFIKNLVSDDLTLVQSLAKIHFQNSDLTSLAPEILKELASVLSCDSLLLSTKHRINPILMVLTLEKLLTESPNDDENLTQLFSQLKREIELFNSNEFLHSDKDLQLLLNLVSKPELKRFIAELISGLEEKAPLKKRLDNLFRQYKTGLIPDSLLADLFIENLTSTLRDRQSEKQENLTELLAIVSPTKAREIIQTIQTALEPELIVNSMFTIALTNPQNEDLARWFYRLENKKQRFTLATILDQIEQLKSQTKHFAAVLSEKEYSSLSKTLAQLATHLNILSSYLFQIHLDQKSLALSDSLEEHLSQLNLIGNELLASLSLVKQELSTTHPEIALELEKLCSNKTINLLSDEIISLCKRVDDFQIKQDQTLATISQEHKLAERLIFNPQSKNVLAKNEPSLSLLATEHSEQTKEHLTHLNQQIIEGLTKNPQGSQLLGQLFKWTLYCGRHTQSEEQYRQLLSLIEKAKPEEWNEVEEQINTLIKLKSRVSSLLFEIQIISISAATPMEELLTVLYKADEAELLELSQLCSLTQIHDFNYLINYVLAARKELIPLKVLKPLGGENVASWIQYTLNSLEFYPSQAMSFKLLRDGRYSADKDNNARLLAFNEVVEENLATSQPRAINVFISSYHSLLKSKPGSSETRTFILTLANLVRHLKLPAINEVITTISPDTLELIINQCLLGLNSDDIDYDQACRYLLTHLCQTQFGAKSEALGVIKAQLGKQDLSILANERLIEIAENVLGETESSLEGHTLNGVWIQRLLTSPRFVAYSTPETLKALIERYRLISLTLKQAEFEQLNQWIQGKLPFYNHHHKHLPNLEAPLPLDPKQKELILAKRERLLAFRADDSIRGLLNQLEDTCFELKKESPELAESALHVLYTHYNNSLGSLRSDLLFRIADFIVGQAMRDQGNLAATQNTLAGWLKHYLPHKNFEQNELNRKQQVLVYDVEGKRIGFITESNQVMTFIDEEPRSLLELPGIKPEIALYDELRHRIGTLALSGEIKRENLFQRETSALLVATVPSDQLSKSAAALNLLIRDIFTENSLEKVYTVSEREKHPWIAEQVENQLTRANSRVHPNNLATIIKYHQPGSVFSLLATIELDKNAEQFFEIILADEQKRLTLFSEEGQKFLFAFLKRHDANLIFANFMVNHRNKPWFHEGLQAFANFARTEDRANLLRDALIILNERTYTQKCLVAEEYDAVLASLINKETSASIIWHDFLKGNTELTDLRQLDSDLADDFTAFFFKHHCMPTIKSLNEQNSWSQSYQYRLILLILAKRSKQFFQENELRLAEKTAWSAPELDQVSNFIKRHLRKNSELDEKGAIGKKVIGELVFRCANFGQTTLFYNQGKFDPQIATQMLERSYFEAIVTRDYLPLEVKKKMEELLSTLKGWFDQEHKDNQKIVNLLKDNQAIIDWRELSNQTWHMSDSLTTMPLISAYLSNYSGPKEPLVRLIRDYIGAVYKKDNPSYLYHVSQVMAKLPKRDVSLCLFSAFEELICKNPTLLDRKLLAHMAQFYAHRRSGDTSSPQAEIQLIKYFGLQKKYGLVKQCCDLLKIDVNDQRTDKLLSQVLKEARVESQLANHLTSWYYPILQFFKRLWNYGFGGNDKTSTLVAPCETEANYSFTLNPPDPIRGAVLGGQEIASQLNTAQKSKVLRERYDHFIESQEKLATQLNTTDKIETKVLGPRDLGLFGNPFAEETTLDDKPKETIVLRPGDLGFGNPFAEEPVLEDKSKGPGDLGLFGNPFAEEPALLYRANSANQTGIEIVVRAGS